MKHLTYMYMYITSPGFSFEVVKIIHEKLLDQIGAGSKVPLVLVGNKTDLHLQRYGHTLAASPVSVITSTAESSHQRRAGSWLGSGVPLLWRVLPSKMRYSIYAGCNCACSHSSVSLLSGGGCDISESAPGDREAAWSTG